MKTVTIKTRPLNARWCPWTERAGAEARRGLPHLDLAHRQVQGFILAADFGDSGSGTPGGGRTALWFCNLSVNLNIFPKCFFF